MGMAGMELERFDKNLDRDQVIIYSLPNCVQCAGAKRFFERNGIDFEERDLSAEENQKVYEFIRAQGATQAPFIETGVAGAWAGENRYKLEQTKVKIIEQRGLEKPEVKGVPRTNASTYEHQPRIAEIKPEAVKL